LTGIRVRGRGKGEKGKKRSKIKCFCRPRFYPSSKTCSSCGHVQDMPLKERIFNCGGCGLIIDRDLNAAKNLEKLG
jgi:putative transposase